MNLGAGAPGLRFDTHIGCVKGSYVVATLEIKPDHGSVDVANMPGATEYHPEPP